MWPRATLQLGQVIGVAVFGSLYLTTNAIAPTLSWIALLTAIGVVVSVPLARTTWRVTSIK